MRVHVCNYIKDFGPNYYQIVSIHYTKLKIRPVEKKQNDFRKKRMPRRYHNIRPNDIKPNIKRVEYFKKKVQRSEKNIGRN